MVGLVGGLTLATVNICAETPDPVPTEAPGTSPAVVDTETPVVAPPVFCALDPQSAATAVIATFGDFKRTYRSQIPGPRGRAIRASRVDTLVEHAIHVETFARSILPDAWAVATPEQRVKWGRALDQMLRKRYLKALQDPRNTRLVVNRSDVSCDRGSVNVSIVRRDGSGRSVDLDLVYVDGRWRVYNVSLDGVSLVRTWRSRFNAVFREGQVAGVDDQMKILDKRYGDEDMARPALRP
jgi:ABC-type transporter MlaC component